MIAKGRIDRPSPLNTVRSFRRAPAFRPRRRNLSRLPATINHLVD